MLRPILTNPTWRAKVQHLPSLDEAPLRPAQITAIKGIEKSLADQHFDRSLVQMATGAGKTFTAVTTAYRLLKFGGFRRILFLVDRNNLADQTIAEFQSYRTPGDGRRFTEIYNVDKLTSAGMLGSSNIVVSTIQRVDSVLRGNVVADQDDQAIDDYVPGLAHWPYLKAAKHLRPPDSMAYECSLSRRARHHRRPRRLVRARRREARRPGSGELRLRGRGDPAS